MTLTTECNSLHITQLGVGVRCLLKKEHKGLHKWFVEWGLPK